ncbi:MAG: HAMP domain-containing sensor histidine kinase [Myxococcales bacterium]
MRRAGRPLYLKLYLAFLGLLIAVAAVALGISQLLGRGTLEVWSRGPRVASHVARSLPAFQDRAGAQHALDQANDDLGLDLALVDAQGQVLAAAGAPFPDPREMSLGRATHFPTWLKPGIVGAPLRRQEHPRMVLLVRIPLPPGVAQVMPWRPILTLLGALIVSAALLYPLSRSITRPLERLTAAAEAFGRGDLSTRAGIVAQDEVGRLARSFDEMADRIQATRRAEKELLATVSHELRTPLARMKVGLELLDVRADPGERQRIAALNEEIDELERLIADVLTASRLDLSALPLRRVPLQAGEVLEKSRARAEALSRAQPIEIAAEPGLALTAEEALLSRALDNLIENARKYAAGGRRPIRVEATRENGAVLFAVRDHGPGFAPDELPRVFDPFYRGESAPSHGAGYGLGLALARRVAEAHGGSIRALNAEGGGARLELRLPAA